MAILNDDLEIVKYLLEQGADLKIKDDFGKAVWQEAALNSHLAMVKFLLTEKYIYVGDLFDEIKNGYLALVKYLVEEQGED